MPGRGHERHRLRAVEHGRERLRILGAGHRRPAFKARIRRLMNALSLSSVRRSDGVAAIVPTYLPASVTR